MDHGAEIGRRKILRRRAAVFSGEIFPLFIQGS